MDAFETFLDRLIVRLDPVEAARPAVGGTIHAAVSLLLRQSAEPCRAGSGSVEILLIKRAQREGDPWSGHLAYPGGRSQTGDLTLLDAALRETFEEVGIDIRSGGRVLGRLPTIEPLSARLPHIDVTPFVMLAPVGVVARPQPAEVEDAFWIPLAALSDGGRSAVVRHAIRGETLEWPAYPSPGGLIWGITERILTGFLALVK